MEDIFAKAGIRLIIAERFAEIFNTRPWKKFLEWKRKVNAFVYTGTELWRRYLFRMMYGLKMMLVF